MTIRALRRRTRPSVFARIRTFWVVAALIVIVAAGGFAAFANAPQLRVHTVTAVVGDGAPVSRDAVLAAAAIGPNANVLLLNTSAIRTRIEAIPYVLTATVHRTFVPQPEVAISVTLRTPHACLASTHGTATIDATARILQTNCLAGVPLQIGIGATVIPAAGAHLGDPDFTALLADAVTIGAKIPLRAVQRDRFGGVEAVDAQGVTLRLGTDTDLAAKLALIDPIRQTLAGAHPVRPIRAIDLRAPTTPVVEYK